MSQLRSLTSTVELLMQRAGWMEKFKPQFQTVRRWRTQQVVITPLMEVVEMQPMETQRSLKVKVTLQKQPTPISHICHLKKKRRKNPAYGRLLSSKRRKRKKPKYIICTTLIKKSLIISAFVGEHLSSASFTLIYMKITTAVSAGRSPKCRLYLEPSHNLKTR